MPVYISVLIDSSILEVLVCEGWLVFSVNIVNIDAHVKLSKIGEH